MLKKTVLVTAIVVMVGLFAVQAVKADPKRSHGPETSPCIECTEEQRSLMHEYRGKKQELRSEMRKEAVDGERVSALREELKEMRAAMDLPERARHGDRKGERANRPGDRLQTR